MKRETKNEMDLLLRRLSRREDAGLRSDAEHLDADELSSYAENALPPPARARYTEHLAECSKCRSLLVQLSASAGVVVAAETSKVAGPSAVRNFLASLFSPIVLRYAVPALGLVVVAVLGLLVLRPSKPDEVATKSSPVEQVASPSPSSYDSSSGFVAENKPGPAAPAPTVGTKLSKAPTPQSTPASRPNAAPGVGSVAVNEVRQDAEKKTENQPTGRVVAELPAPKVVVIDSISSTADSTRRRQEEQTRTGSGSAAPTAGSHEQAKADDRKAENAAGARATSANEPQTTTVLAGAAKGRLQRDGVDAADKDAGET